MAIDLNIREQLNAVVYLATLIDAETSTTDGEWFYCAGFESMSFHVDGVSGETLHICGSNNPTKPVNTVHGIQLGSDITADGLYVTVTPTVWIKARISVGGAGTVSVFFLGVPKKTR